MMDEVINEAVEGGDDDRLYLKECLRLAARARGHTSPNPMVGAVVVQDSKIVGRAYHQRAGAAHAEQQALTEAGSAARGATLYTNIEPCCHQGRTPPCVASILAAGIRRVVACIVDPDERVGGDGFRQLRESGVDVTSGLLAHRAARLNEGYLTLKTLGRPFVIGKAAVSLDGKLATRSRQSQWITGSAARRKVHRLRSRVDAVMVGSGTVLADDPRLTVRTVNGQQPRFRVVLDSRLRTPPDARLLTEDPGSVLIFASSAASQNRRLRLESAGAAVIPVPTVAAGNLDLEVVLDQLATRDVVYTLIEGGSQVLTAAFEVDIIDKLILFYAPLLIGGSKAPSLWGGEGNEALSEAPRLQRVRRCKVGDDWMVEGYLHPPQASW